MPRHPLPLILLVASLAACQQAGVVDQRDADRDKIASINAELAFQYIQGGDYETALSKIDKALEANPRNVAAHNAMGLLRARLGQYDDADAAFRRALAIDPGDAPTRNNYGQFLCQRARYEEGEAQFLEVIGNPLYRFPAAAYSNAGTCAMDAGDLDRAENHFRAALKIDPRLAPALIQMSDISFRLGRYLPARAYLQRYLEVARHTPRSLWLGVQIERELDNRDAVASYSLQLEKSYPDSAETKLLLESRAR
ncbi:MAG: type IV pilus biogenesis/stability protein PilW [Gammaproteobacteria bacterium]